MLGFQVDASKCTRCGECIADCPAHIIAMSGGYPAIAPDRETDCLRCQHCLAVCPTGAVSILGLKPEHSVGLAGARLEPRQLEVLMMGRRSVRRYRDANVDPVLLQHLLEVAWHAPTGVNSRQVRFTVVDDKDRLAQLRDEVMAGLARLALAGALPERLAFFADFVRLWREDGIDTLFRHAPHLLVASAPRGVASPTPDCLIAMSYFELLAQAHGVGTVWDGLAQLAIDVLVPETRRTLGIPEDDQIGCAMAFGLPAVRYARTVQHQPAIIHRM